MKTKQEVEAYYEQSIDQDIWDAAYRAGIEYGQKEVFQRLIKTIKDTPINNQIDKFIRDVLLESIDTLRIEIAGSTVPTTQEAPQVCNSDDRLQGWEEEFDNNWCKYDQYAIYGKDGRLTYDKDTKSHFVAIKTFIRILLDKARKEAKAFYELEYQNKAGAQEALIAKVRREERERCVEVLIRRINDMEKGITNPYKSGSITDTFTDCILWGLRKAIDELEVTNSKTQG